MLKVSEIEPDIQHEFSSRLEPLGFQRLGRHKWLRSQKHPVRELFGLTSLKGGRYCPVWGFSSGFVPSFKGQTFRRQSTDKNAINDLVIDPIDITGLVPSLTFRFISGYDTEIPTKDIRACAEYFVPLALADFDRVQSVRNFCHFFIERSEIQYRRFMFHNYVQHQLAFGFVLILMGRRDEGVERIREFCRSMDTNFEDRILSECICHAESHGATST